MRSFLISAAALAVAAPAWAQTQPEEQAQATNQATEAEQGDLIIVTATKRASTVQDVPFSINAQTQEDIEKANASTIEEISRNVAGLAVQNLGPGQSQVSVRGVSAGQIVRDQPGVKEQVGVYLDESVVSLSLFTPDFDLFDLNRVETLRGPQGTLFGSGSVGGTVRYITNQPRLGRTEGQFEANINNVHDGGIGGHLKGALNLPLGDSAAFRGVAYFTKYAGFIDAFGPGGGNNVNDGGRAGVRLSVLMQPIEALKITPRFVYQKASTHGFNRQEVFNLYRNDFTNGPDAFDKREQFLMLREKFRDETKLADLTVSYDFGGVELTSVSTWLDRDILVSRDASALTHSVSIDLGLPLEVTDIPSNLRDTTDLQTLTQELRLASTGSGPFQWLVGLFYTDIDRAYHQRLPTPGYDPYVDEFFLTPGCLNAGPLPEDQGLCAVQNPDPLLRVPLTSADLANGFPADSPYNADLPYDIKQKAVFGEASYDFGQFKVTAGARYYDFKEVRDFISGGVFSNVDTRIGDKTSSNGFSPRAILTWEPNRNLSVNLQAAKGFRLGGVNDPLNETLCEGNDIDLFGGFQTFDDETLWNYEAGVKYSKGPVTLNAALFHTKIKDLQVTLDAGSCSSRISFNVPKAHTTGLELEVAVSPLQGLDLSLAGSYASAEFDSTLANDPSDPDDELTVATGIREGNRLPSVPKFQMAATASYTTPVSDTADLYFVASFQHVGSRYTQPADQESNPREFEHGLPVFGMDGSEITTLDLKLPSYNLVNLSTGLELNNGMEFVLYANNLFDENAKLAFDRERGGRARLGFHIGTPRTVGLTFRKKFGQ